MQVSYFILYLFIVLRLNGNVHSSSLRINQNSHFQTKDVNVLNTFIDVSFTQCMSECSKRPRCEAVEYRNLAKLCSLRRTISDIEKTPGFVTVTGFNATDARHCVNQTCGDAETCESGTSNCIVTECGHPDAGLIVEGNRYAVGSKLLINRGKNNGTYTRCMELGLWNIDITCHHMKRRDPNAQTGIYKNGLNMQIFCDFDTDGGYWLVFQRRTDGSVDFYRNWTDYKEGFGDPAGEFWFGLENLHTILKNSRASFEFRVDLEDWGGNARFAVYNEFDLAGESDNYRLHCQGYSGTAGDGMNDPAQNTHGMMFSTYDNDNDVFYKDNCARKYHGAWWYNKCHRSNLNGRYYQGGNYSRKATGVGWFPWSNHNYSLKYTAMKVRERQTILF